MRVLSLIVAALLAMPVLTAAADESKGGQTVIVFDASGSMWGRIDGRAKIEIAREALDKLLDEWPQGAGLGLTVYGHRRKGDCDDIETLAAPDNTDAQALRRAVSYLNPKGKTPMSEAVSRAAKALRHTEERASVILVSDGRETCGADPCVVGSELERAGLDFTAHVIGFDVKGAEQAGLRCLAENTGGEFFAAAEAGELQAALGAAAEQVQAAERGITLKAVDRPNGPALRADGMRWTVTTADGSKTIIDDEAVALPELELEPGTYIARTVLGDATGETRFEVSGKASGVHEVMLELQAALDAPDEVAAGSELQVGWEGPDKEGDYITVVAAGTAEGEWGNYTATSSDNPVTLRAPDEPGAHEVRYVSGQSNTTLASAPIEIKPVEASVAAPEQIGSGSTFQVEWQGPDNEGDYITIVAADTPEGAWGNYTETSSGNPLTVRAPDEAGDYELRYLSGQQNKTLAREPVEVIAADVSLDAPKEVTAGDSFQVSWQGPDNEGDYVTIVATGTAEGEWGNYIETRSGNPLTLRAPDTPGNYEIRYLTGQSNKTLARTPIQVMPVEASLEAPGEVAAGEGFEVEWQGPDNEGDYVTIVAAGTAEGEWGNYIETRSGNPLTLRAPDTPGDYEIRYLTGQSNKTLARTPIQVMPVEASLKAPGEVAAGEGFEVEWQGPDHDGDYITIVPAGADEGQYGSYAQTAQGSPLSLEAPEETGDYEIRYVTGQSGKTVARRPIGVE